MLQALCVIRHKTCTWSSTFHRVARRAADQVEDLAFLYGIFACQWFNCHAVIEKFVCMNVIFNFVFFTDYISGHIFDAMDRDG